MQDKENNINFENTSLTSNMEDYIEQIELISRKKKVVRVKDIAKNLDIKMPSVTAAMIKLDKMGLVHYEKYAYVELTEEGKKLAAKVYNRHILLARFFHQFLRIDKKRAEDVACRIEHFLSPESLKQLSKLFDFYILESENNEPWTKRIREILDERSLNELNEGDSSTILKINNSGALKKRLQEMGFRKGETIKVIKYAPLNDPIKVAIKDFTVSLRVDEAKSIIVKPVL